MSPSKRIAAFVGLVIVLTAPFWGLSWLDVNGLWKFGGPKTRELFVTGLMWCPGIAALIACRVTGKSWRELGLEPPPLRYLAAAFAIPLSCIALAYAGIWLSGFGAPDLGVFADVARKKFSLPDASVGVLVAVSLLVTASIGVLAETGRSLGEELGWRGFLVPELLRRHSLAATSLLSGLVWALWHFPLLVPLGSDTPMPFMLACFLGSVVAVSFFAAWLRWRSGSVWPAVVLHSTHNALLYPFFDAMTVPSATTGKFAVGEAGLAMLVAYVAAAVVFWRATRRARLAAGL